MLKIVQRDNSVPLYHVKQVNTFYNPKNLTMQKQNPRQAGLGGVLFAAGPHEARLNRSLLYLWYYSTFPPGSAAGLPGVLFLHRQVFGVVDCIHLLNMV